MDEGKPAGAKWWSRPRPQASSERQSPADPRPETAAGPPAETNEGDFELARPTPTEPLPELVPESAESAGSASSAALLAAGSSQPVVVQDGAGFGEAGPVEAGPVQSGPVAGERPKPLHDPDPYSTPPYGEPGPWAPAPPVQHPAVTPAHGTALPPPGPVPPAIPSQAVPGPPASPPIPQQSATEPADPWHRYDPWAPAPLAGAHGAGAAVGGPFQQTGAGVDTEAERRRRVRGRLLGGALAVALVSGGLGGAVGTYLERNGGLNPVRLPQASAEPTGRAADSVAGIAARALPSVVTLHVSGSEEAGTGTGFVLDSRGYILTNNHVVEPAGGDGEISVVFNGGQTAEAEVVGRDSGYDLAVVRVTGVKGLQPLRLGNSDNVQVGDPVVAIGAPFDLEGTVTSGIISARERPVVAGGESGDGSDVSYVDALQTDAPINPGNSGGPLLDAQGHVIGINSAIRSADDGTDSGSAQAGSIGLGFAIPINQGKRVAEELINNGRATHPVIGITLDLDYAGDGARVGTAGSGADAPVTAGGPGDRAGIRAGDVVTEVDGQRIHSGEELIVKTRAHRPGDRLELTIQRAGQERTLTLVLGSSGG
ncbi:trypsin-like peptidase domain-containing protein [Streptomyces sp. NPDC020951]|uniref:trypsin-like peptidase domain-containing protein n=1 Tax=Streptomyces sp. NPDC020951 TaxID=3365104 RepID=UPI0037BCA0B7